MYLQISPGNDLLPVKRCYLCLRNFVPKLLFSSIELGFCPLDVCDIHTQKMTEINMKLNF